MPCRKLVANFKLCGAKNPKSCCSNNVISKPTLNYHISKLGNMLATSQQKIAKLDVFTTAVRS